ncbi:MAG: type I phosphomannose isomerase catalytic subunit [Anaerolineae bacterium]|jgi:mannose-6-phosphate isomerase|nr:class I mannose-6-phosphate isomerase [Chloroflexota bacterium]
MPDRELYPLLFEPQLRHYIWGGRRLESLYGRKLPPGPTAESWEVSGHAAALTRVLNGSLQGLTLPELYALLGNRLYGDRVSELPEPSRFPLLIKLLDAHRDLSVQVHPDDAATMAQGMGPQGKTEAWYVLAADEGACLVYGLEPGTTEEEMERAMVEGNLGDVLGRLPVTAGDCVFVPAGTVHALLAGTLVVEIQQTSDATYRLYDWGRLATDGRPRPLHIAQALEAIRWEEQGTGLVQPRLLERGSGMERWCLIRVPQFTLERVVLQAGAEYRSATDGATFEIWGCIAGNVQVQAGQQVDLEAVRFTLLPAAMGAFAVRARTEATLLRAYLGPCA